jgi:hypothetical protein
MDPAVRAYLRAIRAAIRAARAAYRSTRSARAACRFVSHVVPYAAPALAFLAGIGVATLAVRIYFEKTIDPPQKTIVLTSATPIAPPPIAPLPRSPNFSTDPIWNMQMKELRIQLMEEIRQSFIESTAEIQRTIENQHGRN